MSCRGGEGAALNSIPNMRENGEGTLATPMEYLTAELRRLDLLLHREILRLRATYQLSLDEFRGLYISDEQVDRLVSQTLGVTDDDNVICRLTQQAEALRLMNQSRASSELPWFR